jgi:hypothetical protein
LIYPISDLKRESNAILTALIFLFLIPTAHYLMKSKQKSSIHDYRERHIYTATCSLADKISIIPVYGEFEFVFQPIGPIDNSGDVVLRLAANPLKEGQRFIELRVHTVSGKSWMGRWIGQGTNDELSKFLREEQTPAEIVKHTRDLYHKLIEDGYL